MPALGALSRSRDGGCGGARRLGSRLYFEFTGAALDDGAAWEGLADGVAVEVRRHGAPPPSIPQPVAMAPAAPVEAAAQDGEVDATVSPAKALAPAALAPRSPTHGVAAPAGVGASSVVNVDNTVNHNNSMITNNSSNNNNGNTTLTNNIVLL